MGFFDFLLRKRKIEATGHEEVQLDNLRKWVQKKREEIDIDKQSVLEIIKAEVVQVISKLDKEIQLLEQINLKERKEDERIKLVVKSNLNQYITHLRRTIANLKDLDEQNPSKLINEINSEFAAFEKKSAINIEKATILLGKEFDSIVHCISNFLRNLKNIQQGNKDLLETSKVISAIELKLDEMRRLSETKSEIERSMSKPKQTISALRDRIKIIKKDIDKIKKSADYIRKQKKLVEFEKKKAEFEKEIDKLKNSINFKALANIYHSNEKKMRIIKEYKNDFRDAFQKDKGEKLLNLFDDAELHTEPISSKIKDLLKKQEEIASLIIEEDDVTKLKSEITKINSQIQDLNSEINKAEKRLDKLKSNKKGIIKSIKDELVKVNVELIYNY